MPARADGEEQDCGRVAGCVLRSPTSVLAMGKAIISATVDAGRVECVRLVGLRRAVPLASTAELRLGGPGVQVPPSRDDQTADARAKSAGGPAACGSAARPPRRGNQCA